MKKIQYLFATIILGLGLTSCGDSFLTKYPEGGTLLEEQYQKIPDRLEGSLRGIYSALYAYSNHQTFGQRSIDMYGDIQCGDMAVKKTNYGWFEDYERGHFSTAARSYIWSYYYDIINLCNRCLVTVDQESIQKIMDGVITTEPDDVISKLGYQYGQLLALRGWAYAGLLMYYCDPMDALESDMDVELAFPLYTETEIKNPDFKGGPRATITEVYDRVYQDLFEAVELLDFYGELNQRESKLSIDADVARVILAYSMLNHGHPEIIIRSSDNANAYDIALEYASTAIENGNYPLLKNADLLKTGFADQTAANWMWAEDVTVENTTALGSFWGQVDIHTYSYAAAGDTKAIDSQLYSEIAANPWDGRVNWFRPAGVKFAYCPDGKFFNPKTKHTTDLDKVDRDWLCDNLFMRIEVAYLIAAEAAYRKGDDALAKSYLSTLCSERIAEGMSTSDMQAWLDATDTKTALVYNWRVEMWGEGYGLQTLRRLSKSVTLGDNHLSRGKQTLNVEGPDSYMYQVEIPTSEIRYNPELAKTELTKAN